MRRPTSPASPSRSMAAPPPERPPCSNSPCPYAAAALNARGMSDADAANTASRAWVRREQRAGRRLARPVVGPGPRRNAAGDSPGVLRRRRADRHPRRARAGRIRGPRGAARRRRLPRRPLGLHGRSRRPPPAAHRYADAAAARPSAAGTGAAFGGAGQYRGGPHRGAGWTVRALHPGGDAGGRGTVAVLAVVAWLDGTAGWILGGSGLFVPLAMALAGLGAAAASRLSSWR